MPLVLHAARVNSLGIVRYDLPPRPSDPGDLLRIYTGSVIADLNSPIGSIVFNGNPALVQFNFPVDDAEYVVLQNELEFVGIADRRVVLAHTVRLT